MFVSISDDLLKVLTHLVDFGKIELGTEQSAVLIDVSTRIAGIENAAQTLALLCNLNGVQPMVPLADMNSEWGRSWSAALMTVRDAFGPELRTQSVLADRTRLLVALGGLFRAVDGRKTHEATAALVEARLLLDELDARRSDVTEKEDR